MQKISFLQLLSEMRDAEKKCLEVVRCGLDAESRREAEACAARIAVYDELMRVTKPEKFFLASKESEAILRATIEKIAAENGSVSDHHFDHLYFT